MGRKQRTHIHPFLDPKLAVESIGEVPRVPRAHLKVEFAQTIVRFAPPLYTVLLCWYIGTNIAVLLDCRSRLDSVACVTYLLTTTNTVIVM